MPGYRQLAHNRDFTVLWIGDTVSELGSALSMFVFPLIAYALSGSALTAALVEAAYLGGLCATLLPAGVLADRIDRRRIMLVSSGTGCVAYTSLALAGVLGALTLPHLLVVALVSGIAAGAFNPAQTSAIRSVVSTEDLPTALSQNQARQHVASLIGGPLGGALYAVTRWLPFVVDAHLLRHRLLHRQPDPYRPLRAAPAPRAAAPPDSPRDSASCGRSRSSGRCWSGRRMTNLVTNAIFFVIVLRMVQEGVPAAQIGLVSTAAGMGGLLGAALAPSLIHRMPTGVLTVAIGWMCCLPLVPLAWSSSPAMACACTFFLAAAQPGRQRRHRRLPDGGHSRPPARTRLLGEPVRVDVDHAAGADCSAAGCSSTAVAPPR